MNPILLAQALQALAQIAGAASAYAQGDTSQEASLAAWTRAVLDWKAAEAAFDTASPDGLRSAGTTDASPPKPEA